MKFTIKLLALLLGMLSLPNIANAGSPPEQLKQDAITKMLVKMVRIPGKNYEIGKYEVTQAEWRAVMGFNPSKYKSCGDDCPIERASFHDVQAFIKNLNAQTGREYRFPTGAEWEYACYGGSQNDYCGSNDIDSVAWYEGNSGNTVTL